MSPGMSPAPLVLASASEARRRLLRDAGLNFEVVDPGVDEAPVKAVLLEQGATPREVADALAELKALKVSRSRPGVLVLGSDQTLDLDGALIDKPTDLEDARAKLLALRGRGHRLHTAAVIARDGAPIWRQVESARLQVRAFSMHFLDAYLEIEQLRLGERLQVHRTLSPGTATALVPTFILQPLVENAIRHGIEPLPAGGNIAISAQIQDQLLILTILDSGVGLNDRAATNTGSRPGIGLANTRARLQNLYPGRHEFKIKNPAGGGCLAELTIPCHSEPVIPQPFPP